MNSKVTDVKLFMFNNDLIIKQDDEYLKLSNFIVQSFNLTQNSDSNIIPGIGERFMSKAPSPIEFGFEGLAMEMSSNSNTFDYREELLREIYKDLK